MRDISAPMTSDRALRPRPAPLQDQKKRGKELTLARGECGARPDGSDDVLCPDLPHRAVLVLECCVEKRRRDVGLLSGEKDHESSALALELPLAFIDDVAQIAEIPVRVSAAQ